MSLIAKIKAGFNHRKTIPFPGIEGEEIKLRILSDGEQQDAELDAELYYRKGRNGEEETPVNSANYDMFQDEKTRQVLFRVIRTLDDKPIAKSMEEFRDLLSSEQREILATEYVIYEKERSPLKNCKTDKEYKELIEKIKKKPEVTLLNIYDFDLLRRVITTLVS